MPDYAKTIRQTLTQGVATPSQLLDSIKISQPTLSRQLRALGDEVVRIGKGKSIQYALRDRRHGLPDNGIFDDFNRIYYGTSCSSFDQANW